MTASKLLQWFGFIEVILVSMTRPPVSQGVCTGEGERGVLGPRNVSGGEIRHGARPLVWNGEHRVIGGLLRPEELLPDRSNQAPLLTDDGGSREFVRGAPGVAGEADKHRHFAAAVTRTVAGRLAFERYAPPELDATMGRLGIYFARQVASAGMLRSRLNKGRILGRPWTPYGSRREAKTISQLSLRHRRDLLGRQRSGRGHCRRSRGRPRMDTA